MPIKNIKSVFLIAFFISCLIYLGGVLHVGSAIWGDSLYYYAYPKSLVIDRDLNFKNEAYDPHFGFPNPPVTSPTTGRVENIFSPGAPFLWLPSFILGQGLTWLLSWLGLNFSLDGYSLITQLSVGLTTVGFSFLGLWLFFLSLKKLFSPNLAALTTLTLWGTSSLFYYTLLDPLNSHSASFLLSSLSLWLLIQLLPQANPAQTKPQTKSQSNLELKLGLTLGWLGLIRNQDILLALPIFIWLFFESNSVLLKLKRILRMGAVIALVMSLQLLITYYLYGQINSPYILHGQELSWLRPAFGRVLFSVGNGLFNFSPIIIVALVGLGQLIKQKSTLAKIGLSFFLLELYVIASWVPEIIGGPYGSRMFTATLPWVGIGLGQFILWLTQKNKKWQQLSLILGIILFLHNLVRIGLMLYLW